MTADESKDVRDLAAETDRLRTELHALQDVTLRRERELSDQMAKVETELRRYREAHGVEQRARIVTEAELRQSREQTAAVERELATTKWLAEHRCALNVQWRAQAESAERERDEARTSYKDVLMSWKRDNAKGRENEAGLNKRVAELVDEVNRASIAALAAEREVSKLRERAERAEAAVKSKESIIQQLDVECMGAMDDEAAAKKELRGWLERVKDVLIQRGGHAVGDTLLRDVECALEAKGIVARGDIAVRAFLAETKGE